jgi:hypothetical protein
MSSLPKDSGNDPEEKPKLDVGPRADDVSVSDQPGSIQEDPWWRTFQLWKVDMRGLKDDGPS